jgi:arginine deiminase
VAEESMKQNKEQTKLQKEVTAEKKEEKPKDDASKALTEALNKKDAEIVTLQKEYMEKMKAMEARQQKLEQQLDEQNAKLTTQTQQLKTKEQELKNISASKNEKPSSTPKKETKQSSNLSKDPLQWIAGTATGIIGGIGAAYHRYEAKCEELIAEPGQLFKKQFWKDL